MDFSTTPTKAFHEDLDFSMGNICSPSAYKTEKKMIVSFATHLHNLPTEHLCFLALVFFSRRWNKSWKKQMVSQAIIRNVPVNKSVCNLPAVFQTPTTVRANYTHARETHACSQVSLSKIARFLLIDNVNGQRHFTQWLIHVGFPAKW